ncbi:hypothetical protein JCM3765_002437 [Sporobolomyces pararoseus]
MTRLPTQPDTAKVIALRSGFYALPFNNGQNYLFTRLHQRQNNEEQEEQEDEEEEGEAAAGVVKLFITGLPLGMNSKGLKQTLSKVWSSSTTKISSIELLPSITSTQLLLSGPHRVLSLLTKEMNSIKYQSQQIQPLFLPQLIDSLESSISCSTSSAVISFTTTTTDDKLLLLLPPPPYPSSTKLSISSSTSSSTSFISCSGLKHSLSRPPRSLITAHVDTWMQNYDSKKLLSQPPTYSADLLIAQREQEQAALKSKSKKGKKGGKSSLDIGPLPGSAAYALQLHSQELSKRKDSSHNPDEIQQGEWTLVTGGGKHGKSLLPSNGVEPTLEGYGGITVKVARKKRGGKKKAGEGEEESNEQGIKKIVGDGFYRFNKADQRRKSLAELRSRFEEDKARVDRMRDGPSRGGSRGGGRGGRGGFSRGGGGSSRGRGGGGGGREGRSFKPY